MCDRCRVHAPVYYVGWDVKDTYKPAQASHYIRWICDNCAKELITWMLASNVSD